jgi:hypothetical protein
MLLASRAYADFYIILIIAFSFHIMRSVLPLVGFGMPLFIGLHVLLWAGGVFRRSWYIEHLWA